MELTFVRSLLTADADSGADHQQSPRGRHGPRAPPAHVLHHALSTPLSEAITISVTKTNRLNTSGRTWITFGTNSLLH